MSTTSSSRGKRSAAITITSPSPVKKTVTSIPRSGCASLTRTPNHLMAMAGTSSMNDGSTTRSPSSQAAEAIKKVEIWEQADILSDDEAWEIGSQDASDLQGRKSMLTTGRQRSGITMDLANKYANEQLQRGKTALESAGNMKREFKVTAIECLQSLYETCLALSDSRSRHMLNLEKERSRHAREIIAIERAHNKKIAEVTKELTSEIALARNDLTESLKEIKAIRAWLGYETMEPYKRIEDIERTTKEINATVTKLNLSHKSPQKSQSDLKSLEEKQAKLLTTVQTLSQQLDELRRCQHKAIENTTTLQIVSQEINDKLGSREQNVPAEITNQSQQKIEEDIVELKKTMNIIAEHIKDAPTLSAQAPQLEQNLQPITERLDAVSSELRTMRQLKERTPPPPAHSVCTEMALVDIVKQIRQPTYAQVASKPPVHRPNHTLIISSTDPKNTGDNVIEKIRVALDCKKTGAKVEKVRKAKNQKIVISCSTKEDMKLVQSQVQKKDDLKVEVAKASNPLLRIADVLSYHTDAELVELILAQNKHLLGDVSMQDNIIRVKYRKKARNPHECHPVLELSPGTHKRFLEAGKIYVGLQRRPVFDQSPLVQCNKCLEYGHTKAVCQAKEHLCSHCGDPHTWEKCPNRLSNKPPTCRNCLRAQGVGPETTHNAFSEVCRERQKWDAIARSRISYC
ncbi:uncharacterized protein LOC126913017 [Spodoptera frugiperda]|uniref:Uncharacterized protein LOC126913017 n=1 Tax=Spodoptera frugiperda TaxID=7108 RepID=A0A9R0F5K0_SPOFR|nr:uncharacterized protein LOC126913017 [Spodoptera frugiperda]